MNRKIRIDSDTALVLEGGGMRGVFTCGVLDNFMDRGLHFPYTVGVSAGSCNGLSFMSRQRGRAKKINIDLLREYNYIGVKYLLTQRNIMDYNWLYGELPESVLPYDYEAYAANPGLFEAVTTNCLTGRALYLRERHDKQRILDMVKASSSLPFVCPVVQLDDIPMLDGGIADSIPLQRAYGLGYKKAVVVLTRNRGYRKSEGKMRIPSFIYKEYPRLKVAIRGRGKLYNSQVTMVEQLEDEGRITVIRPQSPVEVDRIEKDLDKLQALYDEGYQCAAELDIEMDDN